MCMSLENAQAVTWLDCIPGQTFPEIVCVEDDPTFRAFWLTNAKLVGKKFACYANPHDFVKDMKFFSKETQFYFDYDLGQDLNGIDIAKLVRQTFQSQSSMVTGNGKYVFREWLADGTILDVFDKLTGISKAFSLPGPPEPPLDF